jgi:osmotically-inducible protein OsmY
MARRLRQHLAALLSRRVVRSTDKNGLINSVAPDEVASEASRRLRMSGRRSLGKIACDCDGGVLSLQGEVPSFYLKQIAQTLVADMDGVSRIDNCLTVTKPIEKSAVRRVPGPS